MSFSDRKETQTWKYRYEQYTIRSAMDAPFEITLYRSEPEEA